MAKAKEGKSGEDIGGKRMRGKPWCHGGDSVYERGWSWVLDSRYKGRQGKEYLLIPEGLPA